MVGAMKNKGQLLSLIAAIYARPMDTHSNVVGARGRAVRGWVQRSKGREWGTSVIVSPIKIKYK